jgi:hypothetical protein
MTGSERNNTQESRILWLLEAAWPNWVPAPELARISLQYGRAIHSLKFNRLHLEGRRAGVGGDR